MVLELLLTKNKVTILIRLQGRAKWFKVNCREVLPASLAKTATNICSAACKMGDLKATENHTSPKILLQALRLRDLTMMSLGGHSILATWRTVRNTVKESSSSLMGRSSQVSGKTTTWPQEKSPAFKETALGCSHSTPMTLSRASKTTWSLTSNSLLTPWISEKDSPSIVSCWSRPKKPKNRSSNFSNFHKSADEG